MHIVVELVERVLQSRVIAESRSHLNQAARGGLNEVAVARNIGKVGVRERKSSAPKDTNDKRDQQPAHG